MRDQHLYELVCQIRQRLDGPRPLYAFTISEAELDRLLVLLREVDWSDRNPSSFTGAALCFYGSRFLCRHHEGGAWKWEGLQNQIGHSGPVTELYRAVQRGFQLLKRTILWDGRKQQLLATLFIEGGLPIKVLTEKSNKAGLFFSQLLADCEAAPSYDPLELANEILYLLGRRLQNLGRGSHLCQLMVRIVVEVIKLRQLLPPGTTDAIEWLEREGPADWRRCIPVPHSSEVSDAFLKRLLEQPEKAAAELAIALETELLDAQELYLQMFVSLPSMVEKDALNARLKIPLPHSRFELSVVDQTGHEVVVAKFQESRNGKFRVQRRGSEASASLMKLRGEKALSVGHLVSVPIEGGVDGSDLPIVFRKIHGRWLLRSKGGSRVKDSEVLVALSPNTALGTGRENLSEPRKCSNGDLIVYRLSGTCEFLGSDWTVTIETGAQENSEGLYQLTGRRLLQELGPKTVWLGLPRAAFLMPSGSLERAHDAVVEWRHDRPQAEWHSSDKSPQGAVTVRVSGPEGERFRERCVVLHPDFSLKLKADKSVGKGRVELANLCADHVETVDVPGVDVVVQQIEDSADWVVALSASEDVPPTVDVICLWQGKGRAVLRVSYPGGAQVFVDSSGGVLPTFSRRTLTSLPGVRARVIGATEQDSFRMIAEVKDRRPVELCRFSGADGGATDVPLQTFRDQIRALLVRDRSLDSVVNVTLKSAGANKRSGRSLLQIARYERVFERTSSSSGDRCSFRLSPSDDQGSLDHEELRVEAVRIWDPADSPVILPGNAEEGWVMEADRFEGGSWIVRGMLGTACVVRPSHIGFGVDLLERTGFGSLEGIVHLHPEKIKKALQIYLKNVDHRDPDPLEFFVGCFAATAHMPFTTLKSCEVLLLEKELFARVLLASHREEWFAESCASLEGVPFVWAAIRPQHWRAALCQLKDRLEESFDDTDTARDIFFSELRAASTGLSKVICGVQPVFAALERQFGSPEAGPRMTLDQAFEERANRCNQRLLLERHTSNLLSQMQRCADDFWKSMAGFQKASMADFGLSGRGDLTKLLSDAPVAAAIASWNDFRLEEAAISNLRVIRDFDPDWYDRVYESTIQCVVAKVEEESSPSRQRKLES